MQNNKNFEKNRLRQLNGNNQTALGWNGKTRKGPNVLKLNGIKLNLIHNEYTEIYASPSTLSVFPL